MGPVGPDGETGDDGTSFTLGEPSRGPDGTRMDGPLSTSGISPPHGGDGTTHGDGYRSILGQTSDLHPRNPSSPFSDSPRGVRWEESDYENGGPERRKLLVGTGGPVTTDPLVPRKKTGGPWKSSLGPRSRVLLTLETGGPMVTGLGLEVPVRLHKR